MHHFSNFIIIKEKSFRELACPTSSNCTISCIINFLVRALLLIKQLQGIFFLNWRKLRVAMSDRKCFVLTSLYWKKMLLRTYMSKQREVYQGSRQQRIASVCKNASVNFQCKSMFVYYSKTPCAFKCTDKNHLASYVEFKPVSMDDRGFSDCFQHHFIPEVMFALCIENCLFKILFIFDNLYARPELLEGIHPM